jgi:hypothetical protein
VHHAPSLSRKRVASTRERRERERATVDDDANSALYPLCTTVSAQCTHALSLSLQRESSQYKREREREGATVDDDANSTLSPLCTTVSGEKERERAMVDDDELCSLSSLDSECTNALSLERE